MLTGLNEKLEKVLRGYYKGEEEWHDVMSMITDSVAAGDYWQVPVEALEEETDEADYPEGYLLEMMPGFEKKTISTGDDELLLCAFTSPEKIKADKNGRELLTVRYSAKNLLEEFMKAENCDGFVLNPWTDDFMLTRETAEKVLELSEKVPDAKICSLQSYCIEPRAVIDTNQILEDWRGGWDDNNEKQEKWELKCYPIMADGRILLLFEMRDEICAGGYDTYHVAHTSSHYRVLEYQMQDGELRQIGKYRFNTQDAYVSTVYLYDGKLNAAIRTNSGNAYTILPMVPVKDDGQFKIYSNIRTMITNSKHEVIVAYEKNQCDECRLPLMIFDEDGDVVSRYHDDNANACLDVTLDKDENLWFNMFPSSTVDMLNSENGCVESHFVVLQGFDSMAFNDDRSKLFIEFIEYHGGSVFYVMTRDEHGNYLSPVRFDFRPEMKEGKPKEISDYYSYGHASTMKSWVLLRADGKLYLYDVNDC